MSLETRSMPFCTPAKMMTSVNSANTMKHISEEKPLEMKLEKYSSVASALPWPRMYSARYLITQPPMTE